MSTWSLSLQQLSCRLTLGVGSSQKDDLVLLLDWVSVLDAGDDQGRVRPLVFQHRRHAGVWVELHVVKVSANVHTAQLVAGKQRTTFMRVPSVSALRVSAYFLVIRQKRCWSPSSAHMFRS